MATTPAELLDTARELLSRPGADERHWRAAIHAAYYAVYHTLLRKLPRAPRGCQKHNWIRDQLGAIGSSNPDPILRNARYSIQTLWDMRVKADYWVTETVTRHDASLTIVRAAQIVAPSPAPTATLPKAQ